MVSTYITGVAPRSTRAGGTGTEDGADESADCGAHGDQSDAAERAGGAEGSRSERRARDEGRIHKADRNVREKASRCHQGMPIRYISVLGSHFSLSPALQ